MTEGVPRSGAPSVISGVCGMRTPEVGALELGAKAISGLRRDASAEARPGPRTEQSGATRSGVAAAPQRWSRSSLCCKKNVLDQRDWATRQQLLLAIVTWIEASYHLRRRQRALGRLTPIEFETIMTTPAAAAAQAEE